MIQYAKRHARRRPKHAKRRRASKNLMVYHVFKRTLENPFFSCRSSSLFYLFTNDH
jgi:hypothetical protein